MTDMQLITCRKVNIELRPGLAISQLANIKAKPKYGSSLSPRGSGFQTLLPPLPCPLYLGKPDPVRLMLPLFS